MYTNWKLTYYFVGCVPGPLSGEGPNLVIRDRGSLLRMPLNLWGSLPVSIPACLCQRSNLSFHWFKLWELCCSLRSPCILNELVVTFVCGRSPWPMPALLDVLVGALEGEGLCPPGWGLCLPRWLGLAARRMIGPCRPLYDLRVPGSCLPAVGWGLCLPRTLSLLP